MECIGIYASEQADHEAQQCYNRQLPPRHWHFLSRSIDKSKCRFLLLELETVAQASSPSPNSLLLGFPSRTQVLTMPRSRGIPRGGGFSTPRGRALQSSSPLIIPISSTSPSSPPPNPSRPVPNSSFETSHFTFRSCLNKPVVTITTTILVAEEAELHEDPISSSSTSPPEASLAQGEGEGPMFTTEHMQEDSPAAEDSTRQRTPPQEEVIVCGPVQHDFGILHLVTPTEGGAEGNEEVTWVAAPGTQAEQDTDPQIPHE